MRLLRCNVAEIEASTRGEARACTGQPPTATSASAICSSASDSAGAYSQRPPTPIRPSRLNLWQTQYCNRCRMLELEPHPQPEGEGGRLPPGKHPHNSIISQRTLVPNSLESAWLQYQGLLLHDLPTITPCAPCSRQESACRQKRRGGKSTVWCNGNGESGANKCLRPVFSPRQTSRGIGLATAQLICKDTDNPKQKRTSS